MKDLAQKILDLEEEAGESGIGIVFSLHLLWEKMAKDDIGDTYPDPARHRKIKAELKELLQEIAIIKHPNWHDQRELIPLGTFLPLGTKLPNDKGA